jgi:hypothetical protein
MVPVDTDRDGSDAPVNASQTADRATNRVRPPENGVETVSGDVTAPSEPRSATHRISRG